MFNEQNKQLLFDLLYKFIDSNGSKTQLDDYLEFLKKEVYIIEASDIASLNPEEFAKELKAEWDQYVKFRQGLV